MFPTLHFLSKESGYKSIAVFMSWSALRSPCVGERHPRIRPFFPPAVPSISCSSYWNNVRDWRLVAVQNLFKTALGIHAWFPSGFIFKHFVKVRVVQSCSCTNMATARKKSHFILSKRSDVLKINKLSIAVHFFHESMLTLLSIDEILL